MGSGPHPKFLKLQIFIFIFIILCVNNKFYMLDPLPQKKTLATCLPYNTIQRAVRLGYIR